MGIVNLVGPYLVMLAVGVAFAFRCRRGLVRWQLVLLGVGSGVLYAWLTLSGGSMLAFFLVQQEAMKAVDLLPLSTGWQLVCWLPVSVLLAWAFTSLGHAIQSRVVARFDLA